MFYPGYAVGFVDGDAVIFLVDHLEKLIKAEKQLLIHILQVLNLTRRKLLYKYLNQHILLNVIGLPTTLLILTRLSHPLQELSLSIRAELICNQYLPQKLQVLYIDLKLLLRLNLDMLKKQQDVVYVFLVCMESAKILES